VSIDYKQVPFRTLRDARNLLCDYVKNLEVQISYEKGFHSEDIDHAAISKMRNQILRIQNVVQKIEDELY
jgi:hypothetical protein